MYGLRWGAFDGDYTDVLEVVSYGQLDDGKTSGSTRRTFVPGVLREDLDAWKRRLKAAGHRTRPVDFIISGDLGGEEWGVREPKTSACHYSGNQARKWGPKFFAPAVEQVAKREEYAGILKATPYSLRRGGISLRLRGEDPQVVADECGTSLQMLDRHYSFAIDDLRRGEPRPADEEWRAARAKVLGDEPRRLRVVA